MFNVGCLLRGCCCVLLVVLVVVGVCCSLIGDVCWLVFVV